jgi:hypothetical protein
MSPGSTRDVPFFVVMSFLEVGSAPRQQDLQGFILANPEISFTGMIRFGVDFGMRDSRLN